MRLSFLGAAGTVTGSKYLLQRAEHTILVDCGLFQGQSPIRQRNWQALPFQPSKLSTVVLTHAHLDHSGYLPLLVKNGFRGRVHCTASTAELLKVLLPDSGYLQEKDAEFANRHKYSKHSPAEPLYTERDARYALEFLSPVEFGAERLLGEDMRIIFERAGHKCPASGCGVSCCTACSAGVAALATFLSEPGPRADFRSAQTPLLHPTALSRQFRPPRIFL
ncbi:MAG: MBL fold metallo-hydrolase [Xanthobacteraceae bacterium]|nr:MBL fold metallo-hydrolase [Xanthobacteraceae bacterium]